MSQLALPRLLLVTDRQRTAGRPLVDLVVAATEAGLRFVQVRERDLDDSTFEALLDAILRRLPPQTWIAVNGRPELARRHTIGLHLPATADRPDLAGIPFWGRSAHEGDELVATIVEGVSYAILGTLFPTPSKPGFAGRGLDWLAQSLSGAAETPVFAIGGIDARRATEARTRGAYGVAVCGAILSAADPGAATARLLEAVERR